MSAPVGYTCPDIDKCIAAVEAAENAANALSDLTGRRGLLERLRDANESLRTWGTEQEELVSERDDEIVALNARIEELEAELIEARILGEMADEA